MATLRYAAQEAANIAKAAAETKQSVALDAYRNQVTADAALAAHIANVSNPHAVTKAQVGLGNCDNTSDADKPVSTATSTALAGKMATWVAAPASAVASGTAGQLAYASGFLYVCVSANSWQRVAIAVW